MLPNQTFSPINTIRNGGIHSLVCFLTDKEAYDYVRNGRSSTSRNYICSNLARSQTKSPGKGLQDKKEAFPCADSLNVSFSTKGLVIHGKYLSHHVSNRETRGRGSE